MVSATDSMPPTPRGPMPIVPSMLDEIPGLFTFDPFDEEAGPSHTIFRSPSTDSLGTLAPPTPRPRKRTLTRTTASRNISFKSSPDTQPTGLDADFEDYEEFELVTVPGLPCVPSQVPAAHASEWPPRPETRREARPLQRSITQTFRDLSIGAHDKESSTTGTKRPRWQAESDLDESFFRRFEPLDLKGQDSGLGNDYFRFIPGAIWEKNKHWNEDRFRVSVHAPAESCTYWDNEIDFTGPHIQTKNDLNRVCQVWRGSIVVQDTRIACGTRTPPYKAPPMVRHKIGFELDLSANVPGVSGHKATTDPQDVFTPSWGKYAGYHVSSVEELVQTMNTRREVAVMDKWRWINPLENTEVPVWVLDVFLPLPFTVFYGRETCQCTMDVAVTFGLPADRSDYAGLPPFKLEATKTFWLEHVHMLSQRAIEPSPPVERRDASRRVY